MIQRIRDQIGSIRDVYLGPGAIPRRDDAGDRDEVVLLLHGFFHTRNVWEVMEDRLRHDGYAVLSFHLGGLLSRFNTHPIDRVAALVAEKVERLAERHGFQRLHVVGHSKGGLIARRWIQHHDGDRRARSLITLGTPHHGTGTALLGVALTALLPTKTSAAELLPRSALIDRLNRDHFPADIPLTSIYSRGDLVCPYPNSILRPRPSEADHLHNIEVPDVGHAALTWDPRVYRQVRRCLAQASGNAREVG